MRSLIFLLLGATAAAHALAPFWMEAVDHQGIASFNPDKNYTIFRNVKDFGARGDGVNDDTEAINTAISSGNRCGGEADCVGTTITPAVVYFPAGTYAVKSSIVDYYYTQLIGDPANMPTIKATKDFKANVIGVLDGDQYTNSGYLKFGSTNVFFRQVRNLRFDTTEVPGAVTAIHWPSSQATSLQNVVFVLSQRADSHHTGIFMEEGSGGWLSDLVFYGGEYGAQFGNQQYTSRNLTFFNCTTAIQQIWNWGWTYKNINVEGCGCGLNMSGPVIGGVSLVDSTFENTPVAIDTGRAPAAQKHPGAGSLVMENVKFKNCTEAVRGPYGPIIPGKAEETVTQTGFAYGNMYSPRGPSAYQASDEAYFPSSSALSLGGKIYERSKPQYEDLPASSFVSARTAGAKGDGITDDTTALNALFKTVSAGFEQKKVAWLDAGYYKVTDTIHIPPNCRIVGEAMSAVIMGAGKKFSDIENPYPVVQVGKPGDEGYVEWSDTMVSTQGATSGADVHVRVGGFEGSKLQMAQCLKTPEKHNFVNPDCIAAYMSVHITKSASNLYMENNWIWVSDHDIEDRDNTQISVFAGRGLLCESQVGRIWMLGTSVEHHAKYQYQFVNTQDIWMGQIQTETPYYQPNPPAPLPFTTVNTKLHDPDFAHDCEGITATNDTFGGAPTSGNFTISTEPPPSLPGNPPCAMAWGLRILNSKNIFVYGAGLYSFFNNYSTSCCQIDGKENCQARIAYVGAMRSDNLTGEDVNVTTGRVVSDVDIYNLNTVGTVMMINQDGEDIALYRDNIAGFTSCVALFRYLPNEGNLGFGIDSGSGSGITGSGADNNGTSSSGPLGSGSGSGHGPISSNDTGYMCFGNWQQLCGEGSNILPIPSVMLSYTTAGEAPTESTLPRVAPTPGTNAPLVSGSGPTSSGTGMPTATASKATAETGGGSIFKSTPSLPPSPRPLAATINLPAPLNPQTTCP